jgi:hypothetical protein
MLAGYMVDAEFIGVDPLSPTVGGPPAIWLTVRTASPEAHRKMLAVRNAATGFPAVRRDALCRSLERRSARAPWWSPTRAMQDRRSNAAGRCTPAVRRLVDDLSKLGFPAHLFG